jgi:hypothetical protein
MLSTTCDRTHLTGFSDGGGGAGTKFLMVADPKHSQMAKVLEQVRAISSLFGLMFIPSYCGRLSFYVCATFVQVYELYSDYVLKNPFYEFEQPIRCEKFDTFMNELMRAKNTPEKK